MHNSYKDIIDRIVEEPTWWDDNGAPRYGEFSPDFMPDIYADEVVFYYIQCQGCGKGFKVAESRSIMDKMRHIKLCPHMTEEEKLKEFEKADEALSLELAITKQYLHYGDPPNTGCCVGTTMNCMDIRVLEYWKKENFDWVRDEQLEIDLSDVNEERV